MVAPKQPANRWCLSRLGPTPGRMSGTDKKGLVPRDGVTSSRPRSAAPAPSDGPRSARHRSGTPARAHGLRLLTRGLSRRAAVRPLYRDWLHGVGREVLMFHQAMSAPTRVVTARAIPNSS